jgi:ADP-heptose:LPS heptosyltransferase
VADSSPPGRRTGIKTAILKFLDATLGSVLCWVLGLCNPQPENLSVPSLQDDATPKRLLLIRPGGLGDLVILLPILHHLKTQCPALVIDLVCEKRNAEVLRLDKLDVNILLYDSQPLGFLWALVQRHYDVVIDSEQFHHFSSIFAVLSGAPARIGFGINPRRNPLYTHLVKYDMDGREGLQFARLLEPLKLGSFIYSLDEVFASTPASGAPRAELNELEGTRPLVALCPSASTQYKAWGEAHMRELVRSLVEKDNVNIVLLGNSRDAISANHVLSGLTLSAGRVISLAGKLSLSETLSVLKQARLYIGSDSGLAHLAAAAGLPTVVLFGPSDPDKWGIQDDQHKVVSKRIACSPCAMFGYYKPCRHVACMKGIEVSSVLAQARALLKAPLTTDH